jgi:hypothetical protein
VDAVLALSLQPQLLAPVEYGTVVSWTQLAFRLKVTVALAPGMMRGSRAPQCLNSERQCDLRMLTGCNCWHCPASACGNGPQHVSASGASLAGSRLQRAGRYGEHKTVELGWDAGRQAMLAGVLACAGDSQPGNQATRGGAERGECVWVSVCG